MAAAAAGAYLLAGDLCATVLAKAAPVAVGAEAAGAASLADAALLEPVVEAPRAELLGSGTAPALGERVLFKVPGMALLPSCVPDVHFACACWCSA